MLITARGKLAVQDCATHVYCCYTAQMMIQALHVYRCCTAPHLHAVQGALQQQLLPPAAAAAAAAAEWLSANNKTAQHKARRSAQKHKQLNAYSSSHLLQQQQQIGCQPTTRQQTTKPAAPLKSTNSWSLYTCVTEPVSAQQLNVSACTLSSARCAKNMRT
jgi:hypothetical protein